MRRYRFAEHYIYASEDEPTINCWFRADEEGNPKQYPAETPG